MLSAAFSVSRCLLFLDTFRFSSQLLLLGIILLFVLYTKIKAKIVGRREDPEANNRDLEEDGKSQQMSDHEKGGAGKDSDSSDVSVLAL